MKIPAIAFDTNPRLVAYALYLQLRPSGKSDKAIYKQIAERTGLTLVNIQRWAKDEVWNQDADEIHRELKARTAALYSQTVFENRLQCLEDTLQGARKLREGAMKAVDEYKAVHDGELFIDDLKKLASILKTATDMETSVLGVEGQADQKPGEQVRKLIDTNVTPRAIDVPAREVESERVSDKTKCGDLLDEFL